MPIETCPSQGIALLQASQSIVVKVDGLIKMLTYYLLSLQCLSWLRDYSILTVSAEMELLLPWQCLQWWQLLYQNLSFPGVGVVSESDHQSDSIKAGGIYHRHLNGIWFPYQDSHWWIPHLAGGQETFLIKVVKAVSDSGGISDQKETGRLDTVWGGFPANLTASGHIHGGCPSHIFADQFMWKFIPLKRRPPFRRVRECKLRQLERPHKSQLFILGSYRNLMGSLLV